MFCNVIIGTVCRTWQDIRSQNYLKGAAVTLPCQCSVLSLKSARSLWYLCSCFPVVVLVSEPVHETEFGPSLCAAVMRTVLIGALLHDCLPVTYLLLCIAECCAYFSSRPAEFVVLAHCHYCCGGKPLLLPFSRADWYEVAVRCSVCCSWRPS